MPRFVDTNILVYAEDLEAGPKRTVARDLLVDCWHAADGALSIQVLQEFFVTVTRKLQKPMKPARAGEIVGQYLNWTVVESTGLLLREAIKLAERSQLSFWDALIVRAALEARCQILYSEDFTHGRRFDNLQIVNPFIGLARE